MRRFRSVAPGRASTRRLSRFALAVISVLARVAAPSPAHADSSSQSRHAARTRPLAQTLTGQAKADYDAGKLLYVDGDFAGALIKFDTAYANAKDPRLLWHIAACQKAQRHYSKVIALLKRYKAEGGALLTPGDVRDATDLIAALEPFTAKVTFNVSEEAADVALDGESVGSTPLAPVVVDIGERHVRVTKEGYVPFEKTVPVGGAEVTVEAKLEKVVHEGRLAVNAPAGGTIFLDDKQLGVGKIDQTVASGGHQLRITGPGMRPYQSEVVIQDRETRTLDVSLEPLELPRLRVAVGCGDTRPQSPDFGLVAYLDGNDVLAPSGVKKSFDPEKNDSVFRYSEYPVTPGTHTLRLRATGCVSDEHRITVDPVTGDDVEGALQLDKNTLLKGPQGTPGWGRVGVAFWMPTLVTSYPLAPDNYGGHAGSFAGVAVDAGLVRRWFSADLALGYAAGSLTRGTSNSNYALPSNASSDVVRGLLRLGPRFPFNVVSFGLGAAVGLEQVNVDGVKTGGIGPTLGSYVELVVQPFCSFGFFAMGDVSFDFASGFSNGNVFGFASLQLGAFFGPSSACRDERNTAFGLREKAAPPPSSSSLPPTPAPPVVPVTPPPSAPESLPVVPAPSPAPPPAPPAAPATDDVTTRLRRLKALLDSKVITEEEYKTQRQRVLTESGL